MIDYLDELCPLMAPCTKEPNGIPMMLKVAVRSQADRAEKEVWIMRFLHRRGVPFVPPLETVDFDGVVGILTLLYPAKESRMVLFRSCLPIATIRKVIFQLFTVSSFRHAAYINLLKLAML